MPGCQGRVAGSLGKRKLKLLEATPIGVIALHRSGKEIAAGKNNAKSQQRFFLSCQTGVADAPLVTSTRRLSVERVTEIETALLLKLGPSDSFDLKPKVFLF